MLTIIRKALLYNRNKVNKLIASKVKLKSIEAVIIFATL